MVGEEESHERERAARHTNDAYEIALTFICSMFVTSLPPNTKRSRLNSSVQVEDVPPQKSTVLATLSSQNSI